MKADETRKVLAEQLNKQLASKGPDEPVISFPSPTFEKPKMFEANLSGHNETSSNDSFDTSAIVRGIGFHTTIENTSSQNSSQEIYNMKELINSNPITMRTLTINPQEIKAQLALVKRKEWQDILFEDVDWLKPIHFSIDWKRIFKV